jgi:hypothetical protein
MESNHWEIKSRLERVKRRGHTVPETLMSRVYGFLIVFCCVFADGTREEGLAREMVESPWEEEQTGLYI